MKVELFTSGQCPACHQAESRLDEVLQQPGLAERVELHKLRLPDALDRAVALGVKALPALAIDDRLVLTGLPSTRQLRQWLKADNP